MDFVLGAVTKTIKAMAKVLSGFSFTRNLADDLNAISSYLQKANYFLPVSETLTVLGLFLTVNLCLIAYYWITRAINLLRGAG